MLGIGLSLTNTSAVGNNSNPLPKRVASLLRKYGSDAHLYMPGPGVPVLGPENITGTWASPGGVDNTTTGTGQSVSVVAGTTGSRCAVNLQGLIPNKTYRLFVRAAAQTAAVTCYLREGNALGAGTIQATSPALGVGAVWDITFVATRSDYNLLAITASASSFTLVDVSCKELQSYTNQVSGFTTGNYLESTGNTNAVVDGAVGLVLDAAGSVGAELSVGGDFSSAANWSVQAGFTVSGGSLLVNAGGGAITNTAGQAAVIGKTYRLEYEVTAFTSGQVKLFMGGVGGAAANAVGKYVSYITATTTDKPQIYVTSASTVCTVDNISVKEITGIHATQATTANKPTLRRGIVNLLTYSNDFSNAAWTKSDGASATSTTLTITAAATSRAFQGKAFSGDITVAVQCDPSDAGKQLHLGVWASGLDGLTTGRTPTALTIPASGVVCYSWAGTVSGTNIGISRTGTEFTLNNPRVGLFQGTLTAQQIIDAGGIPLTTTAPASSARGAYAWQFDGSNDSLALPGPLFQLSDDHCVVTAAKVDSGSITATVFSESSTAANGPVIAIDFTSGAPRCWWRDDAQANFIQATDFLPRVGQSLVVSLRKTGNAKIGRCNGVQMAATDTAVMGATTINTSNVGALVRTTSSGFMQGNTYAVLAIKGTVSDSDLRILEKWIGSLAGVPIP